MNRIFRKQKLTDSELQKITEEYTPLVRTLAKRYEGRGAEFDDLVQEGYLALLKLAPRCRKKEYLALFLQRRLPAKIRNAAQRLRRKYTIEADLTEEEDFDPEDAGQKISTAVTQLMAGLEKNEYQLLKLVAMGYLQKEIAEKLGITQQAVSSRIKKLRNSAKTLLD